MARTLTAKEICERALRAIGTFPLSESAPDGEQMREALHWLDLIMAEIGGTGRLFHLIDEGVGLKLLPGQGTYRLKSALGTAYPVDGIQFPIAAHLLMPTGQRRGLTIINSDTWGSFDNPETPGLPHVVFIDRQPIPTLHTYPTLPKALGAQTFVIQLDVQRYTPNVAPGGVTGATPQGSVLHGFREAWQRYLIMRLAQDLASGPIIKLPQQSIAVFKTEATEAKTLLMRFENQEHDNEDPICRPYDDRSSGFYVLGGAIDTSTPAPGTGGNGNGNGGGTGGTGGTGGPPSSTFYIFDDSGTDTLTDENGNPFELE